MLPRFARILLCTLASSCAPAIHAAQPLRSELTADARIAPGAELVLTLAGDTASKIKHGFRTDFENTFDWSDAYGLSFDLRTESTGARGRSSRLIPPRWTWSRVFQIEL